jgi:ketosteroid isomerase-like protein
MPEQSTTPDVLEILRRSAETGSRLDYDGLLRYRAPNGVWDVSRGGLRTYEGHVDLARLFRDDAAWMQAASGRFTSDVQCVVHVIDKEAITYTGLHGFRAAWLDRLKPWVAYRSEIEEAIDCGDRVLLLVRDVGRKEGTDAEVRSNYAAIWTVDDGKIARAEFYPDRMEARKAVGLD